MRASVATVLGLLLAAALWAPAASALPGDPQIELLSPADGATVAPSGEGHRFRFTCPDYRTVQIDESFALHGAVSDHTARLASAPDLGDDGRLRQDRLVDVGDVGTDNTLAAGECAAVMGDESRAGLAPGVYWWQVSRICTGCAGSYESSAPRRLVVRADVRATVAPPRALHGGYPAAFAIRATGAPDGSAVRLERQAGGGWKPLARGVTRDGGAELIATIAAGRARLRVVGAVGGQRFESAPLAVTARPDRGPHATSAASDGAWRGTRGAPVRFTVAAGGRLLRDFRANVTLVCPAVPAPGSVGGQVTTQAGVAAFGRARIAPDGSFLGVAVRGGSAVLVRGRLNGRALRGGLARASVGACVGSVAFGARRG